MSRKLVHVLSAVNATAVSKTGNQYLIRDVCGAIDGIVMNRALYPADQLQPSAATLNSKPAPAGHPKNAEGQFISATNGDALLTSYMGAVCRNARHEGGRTLVDVVINEAQARAHPDGLKVVERLDAALAGTNTEPIHVSTGLYAQMIQANGESGGKPYDRIATQIQYDHLAILLHEKGAGAPDQGVGMFLNAAGQAEAVETVALPTGPEDRRGAGLMSWVRKLLGNGGDVSFDAISDGLYKALPEGAWLREVFDRYAVWTDQAGKLWRQDYTVSSDGSVAWSGTAVEVRREVRYETVANHLEPDPMKDLILAALNAAGITVNGKTDQQLLADYEALKLQPVQAALTAANSKVAEFEQAANAARDTELNTLAAELATNSTLLTAADFKAMGLARCKELKATGKPAAPVLAGNGAAKPGDEFATYDLNALYDSKPGAAAH